MLTIMITMNDWISRRIKYVTKNDYLGSKSQTPLQGNYNFENIPMIAHKLIVIIIILGGRTTIILPNYVSLPPKPGLKPIKDFSTRHNLFFEKVLSRFRDK